jgi:hypothetical protein
MPSFLDWLPSALWTRKRTEKWWLDRYPGDCILSLDRKRRSPLLEMSFREWRELCSSKGFGPHSDKELTTTWAEIVFQTVTNKFDPLDERLVMKSDAQMLAECNRDRCDLPHFQFWEFDGDVVEVRLARKGFRFVGESWIPFDDIRALLARGIPISYREMRNRVPIEFVNTNESNLLYSFNRKQD